MVDWLEINENDLIAGKNYLLTDGAKIAYASYEKPYNNDRRIWFSESTNSYVHLQFTHYAEINFPPIYT